MAMKPFTPEERQAYLEQRKAQREELETKVHNLVDSFRDSDTFKTYLSKMSEFNRNCAKHLHRYSPNNLLFIMTQDPTASIVGAAGAWRRMGRTVKKGEQAHIQVWAPIKDLVMQNKLDENGEPILKADGTPEREPVRDEEGRLQYRFSGRFTLKPVFDISQTDGEPLPQLVQELKDPVEHFADYEKAIRSASPLPIYMSDEPEAAKLPLGEAKGVCSFSDRMIVVKAGMSEQHTLKTMIHEVTHAKFHSPEKLKAAMGEGNKGLTRNEIEVQAESTAFVVCDHFGLDTSDYSIPYIMSWGEDKKLTPLTNSLDAILTASSEVIDAMETHLWVDMGIDEAYKHIETETLEIAAPSCMLADPQAQSLMQAGYVVREGDIATPEGSVNGLIFSKGDGSYRIKVELIPDLPDCRSTALSAYDLTGKEPEKFFEARFDAPLQKQMAALHSNSQYLSLSAPTREERGENMQDPVAYMQKKREERRAQVMGPRNKASHLMRDRSAPKRDYTMER